MGSLSDYAENELLDHLYNAAYSPVASVYLALHTADPTDAGSGAEVADANNYTRKAITFGAAASRRVTQNAQVDFNQASGSWGTVTHWGIWDNSARGAGNLLAHGAFSSPFAPVSGNSPRIANASIYVEISATGAGAGHTDYAVHSLLNLMFRNVAFTSPAGNTFLALLGAVADDQDVAVANLTEITGTDYARKEVNPNGGSSPTWDLASGGTLDNGADVIFATPGAGGWSQFVSFAIVDTASGAGNVLAYGNDIQDQTPAQNDIVQFAAGALDLTLT